MRTHAVRPGHQFAAARGAGASDRRCPWVAATNKPEPPLTASDASCWRPPLGTARLDGWRFAGKQLTVGAATWLRRSRKHCSAQIGVMR
jgi:hypothetical protein